MRSSNDIDDGRSIAVSGTALATGRGFKLLEYQPASGPWAKVVANNTISGRIDIVSDHLRGGGDRQLGVKSVIWYSVAGVSRAARQVS
jgi:hypothetical protein